MSQYKILVTGGAGFIGSNIVEALIADDRVSLVRVLDNLATGFYRNLKEFEDHPKFEFFEGDLRKFDDCMQAAKGIDKISHQAALGSVPRSINDPLTTNDANINGTLNIFTAAKEKGIKRVVYAASSSTYGDSAALPKQEENIGNPLSPYAVTKLVNELYARVYGELYRLEMIGLRYFNVFGPKQDPSGAYAAVIPLFMKAILEGKKPTIHGDGTQSRDFTFVKNVVQANVKALFIENPTAVNQIYNIAYGKRTTLNQLFEILKNQTGSDLNPFYGPERVGDVKHSLADITKAKAILGYDPEFSVVEGLRRAFEWYKENLFILKK